MALLLLILLLAGLLALLPVWRLRVAGWPVRSLAVAWIVYTIAIVLIVRIPSLARYLGPILLLAFVAPFVAGPERLTRVLTGRREPRGVIIDVTPRLPPALPEPPAEADDHDAGDGTRGGDDPEASA